MTLTKKHFDKILLKLKLSSQSDSDRIRFYFDNDHFMIDGYYCLLSKELEDVECYLGEQEAELSEKQREDIYTKVQDKLNNDWCELKISNKENKEWLTFNEIG